MIGLSYAEPTDQAITFERTDVGRKYMQILVSLDEYYRFDVLNVGVIIETELLKKWQSQDLSVMQNRRTGV